MSKQLMLLYFQTKNFNLCNAMDKIEQLEIALKILKAEKDGKPLKWEFKDALSNWATPTKDVFYHLYCNNEIRLKPWTLGREVNGHALPEGREWFKGSEFKEADLPEGYRPLMVGETSVCDECWNVLFGSWDQLCHTAPFQWDMEKIRTKRPIAQPILTEEQKAAGWIEWHGGENPIPGKRCEYIVSNRVVSGRELSDLLRRQVRNLSDDIIAYRVVEPEYVDLGPEDVPPGSVIRGNGWNDGDEKFCFLPILEVTPEGVWVNRLQCAITWKNLIDWKINRSIPLTGKWNPNAWEPCRKEKA